MEYKLDILFKELVAKNGLIGEVILNRAKALNALTFDMVSSLYHQLVEWQQRNEIQAVLIRSSSEKAFCAGGDVVGLYQKKQCAEQELMPFFKMEYQLNCLIRDYAKPYISLLDGITMGGGVGISLHGDYAIATEKFSFAMPETTIGFFPDVGGGYLLSHCRLATGCYLGLTGQRLNRWDAMQLGLIKYGIAHHQQEAFVSALLASDLSTKADVCLKQLLSDFHDNSQPKSQLELVMTDIEACFSKPTVEQIISALQTSNNTRWAKQTLESLASKAPMALKVTLEQIKRCQQLDMRQAMAIEYCLVSNFIQATDFFEGIRALLIDKDKNPQWQPGSLAEIDVQMVDDYFEPKAGHLWD